MAQALDANYALVVFGGLSGYGSDDLTKFLWFVRIAAGVFSDIQEWEYYNQGQFAIDVPSDKFKYSMAYQMMYHRFGELYTMADRDYGTDMAR